MSSKGTNDNMNFTDKNFYKINNKHSIALPHGLSETKEVALIDKDEQSLQKLNIELSVNDNTDTFEVCKYCQNTYISNKSNQNTNINNTKHTYSQYSHPLNSPEFIEL